MAKVPTENTRNIKSEKTERARFCACTPILSVQSVPTSIDYYVKCLAFHLAWEWGEPATFACVTRGDVSLFLCEGTQGNAGTWVHVSVDNVDQLYREYQSSGATIIQAPTNFPWGSREMNVEDLDGHRLRLSSDSTGDSDGAKLPE